MSYCHALLSIYQPLTNQCDRCGIKLEKTFFSTYTKKNLIANDFGEQAIQKMKECYKNKKSLSIKMHNQMQDHRGNACLEIDDSKSTKDF